MKNEIPKDLLSSLPTLEEVLSEESEIDTFMQEAQKKLFNDIVDPEDESIDPDTFGCECIFICDFVTEEMDSDFLLIARDFFIHEATNLPVWYDETFINDSTSNNTPDYAFQNLVLNLMMSAAKKGNEYAISLFCKLHKTYYKKEYKTLKRFRSISADEAISLAGESPFSMARLLCCAKFYGIKIEKSCNFLYVCLSKVYQKAQESRNKKGFLELDQEVISENEKKIMEMFGDEEFVCKDIEKVDAFVHACFRHFDFHEKYLEFCSNEEDSTVSLYAEALSLYNVAYPEKDKTPEDMWPYVTILRFCSALTSICSLMEDRAKLLLNIANQGYYDVFPPLYKSDVSVPHMDDDKNKETSVAKQTVLTEDANSQEALLNEIEALRAKLKSQSNEAKHFHQLYDESKKIAQEQKEQIEALNAEHQELVALREHVYKMSQQESAEGHQVSLSEMKEKIADKRILIIGGHINWVKKLKNEFPKWIFVEPEIRRTIDVHLVENIDQAYFFTDTISHATYYRFLDFMRGQGMTFGYISSVNINANVKQIYEDLFS